MPSGRRSSEPGPVATISGKAPSSAAMVVIMMGRKRSRQASKMARSGSSPRRRSPSSAKSTIMIPFFFVPPLAIHTAYYAAGVVAFIELFLLGMFLGRIGRERLWLAGVKLVAAGAVALVISLLLNGGRA